MSSSLSVPFSGADLGAAGVSGGNAVLNFSVQQVLHIMLNAGDVAKSLRWKVSANCRSCKARNNNQQ